MAQKKQDVQRLVREKISFLKLQIQASNIQMFYYEFFFV